MSRQIQIRRGNADENDAFTGAIGEVTMDTTNKTLRVHDGTTVGGTKLAKQSDVSAGLNDKLNKTLDNIPDSAKATSVSWGRQFTNIGTTIAQGNANIAGTYTLGFTDNKVKIGIFECRLSLTQTGGSEMSICTDVMNVSRVAGTNNGFKAVNTITIPFINSITIGFPQTGGGIDSSTYVKFIGWM